MSSSTTQQIHRTSTSSHGGWPGSASSIASGAVGVVLLVIGIVAVARAGLGDLTSPAVAVGPFVRTTLMGLIEIVLGVIAMATAADRSIRGASALAVVTGVAGIVWLIESAAFAGALGLTVATGWLYVVIAAALLAAVAVDRSRHDAVV